MSSAKFKARIVVEDGGTKDVEVWSDDLTPFDGKRCSIRDWVKMHFDDVYHEDLREMLGLPPEGNFECLVEGTITGEWYGEFGGQDEYNEYVEVKVIQQQKIPDSVYEDDHGLETFAIDEDVSDEQAAYCQHVQELDKEIDRLRGIIQSKDAELAEANRKLEEAMEVVNHYRNER